MELFNDDCMKVMKEFSPESIDFILCDLPYGVTGMEWDNALPLDDLWEQYKRLITLNGVVVLFSSGMFTYDLIMSNPKWFKYKLIWEKNVPTGMSSAKYRPMKYYEEICVFSKGKGTYNPLMAPRKGNKDCYRYDHYCGESNHVDYEKKPKRYDPDWVNPSDILKFNVVPNRNGKLHPTQKPVPLLEYLIKTYSNEGDTVLDNCMGSGSTGEACINTNRKFIGIEIDENYFNIAEERLGVKNDRRKQT